MNNEFSYLHSISSHSIWNQTWIVNKLFFFVHVSAPSFFLYPLQPNTRNNNTIGNTLLLLCFTLHYIQIEFSTWTEPRKTLPFRFETHRITETGILPNKINLSLAFHFGSHLCSFFFPFFARYELLFLFVLFFFIFFSIYCILCEIQCVGGSQTWWNEWRHNR